MHGQRHGGLYLKLGPPPPGAVRWTQGFWADRFELCREVMLPAMKAALEDAGNGAALSNFYIAAGMSEGERAGTDWSDGDCYKWLEAAAHVYGVTRDGRLDEEMDGLIEAIGRAQESDGYISTPIQLTGRERWQDLHHHELYNMGHLMTAACVHHRSTGKETLLGVARKTADYLHTVFASRPAALAHFGFNPSQIMGLVDLYRTTGEPRYLELASTFVEMRGSAPGGSDLNQTSVPLRQETEAVGHAVAAMYLWCGATDVYTESGDRALLAAIERLWRDVTERKMYLTGGVGALHQGVSLRGHAVHEAFGRAHQLPNATAYNETCANIANAMWNQRLLSATGDAKYAEVMELALYNSMLSGMSLDGLRFCYTNPLRRAAGAWLQMHDSPERWSRFPCYCCPPQVLRTIAGLHEWAYSLSEGAVWIHLYGGSTLEARIGQRGSLSLHQESDYPWSGEVRVMVEAAPAGSFAILLRVPAWATAAQVLVNGEAPTARAEPGAYVRLERQWRRGDEVLLSLPMAPRLLEAHPAVEETRNQVAVMRGPVVYCLESPDLPAGVRLDGVRVPRDAAMFEKHDPQLLGGVTALEVQAVYSRSALWAGELYRAVRAARGRPLRVRMIPYYAWGNRGAGEMTVWLPMG